MWQHWINALLGLAVIVVPFIGLSASAFSWTLAILGIAIAVIGLWGALESSDMRTMRSGEYRRQS
jgi:predicted ferric reductase